MTAATCFHPRPRTRTKPLMMAMGLPNPRPTMRPPPIRLAPGPSRRRPSRCRWSRRTFLPTLHRTILAIPRSWVLSILRRQPAYSYAYGPVPGPGPAYGYGGGYGGADIGWLRLEFLQLQHQLRPEPAPGAVCGHWPSNSTPKLSMPPSSTTATRVRPPRALTPTMADTIPTPTRTRTCKAAA
jgi:hypothetical protein